MAVSLLLLVVVLCGCSKSKEKPYLQTVNGKQYATTNQIWLTHEHVLVDFIGADSIMPSLWNHDSIMEVVLPYLDSLKSFKVAFLVDATPNYLGRDAVLLKKIADKMGIMILTNTGLYGARTNRYIPKWVKAMTPQELAEHWTAEFENGINNTPIKPGFIKIGIDSADPLDTLHQKLVEAAGLTHLKTGLVIASHTGKAIGLWPQLKILNELKVPPESFIWVHAQEEPNPQNYLKAAKEGCWISLDGLGWELEKHLEKLVYAKQNNILDHILISHDAGWYDPQKEQQNIQSYTAIFRKLLPALKAKGFSEADIDQLLSINPSRAYSISSGKIPGGFEY
ncbi:MAG: phosphotriesterase [Flavobacteriaceae bacterium]|nr:phosphotriesterase [Flavobacteriaceae bacterium]